MASPHNLHEDARRSKPSLMSAAASAPPGISRPATAASFGEDDTAGLTSCPDAFPLSGSYSTSSDSAGPAAGANAGVSSRRRHASRSRAISPAATGGAAGGSGGGGSGAHPAAASTPARRRESAQAIAPAFASARRYGTDSPLEASPGPQAAHAAHAHAHAAPGCGHPTRGTADGSIPLTAPGAAHINRARGSAAAPGPGHGAAGETAAAGEQSYLYLQLEAEAEAAHGSASASSGAAPAHLPLRQRVRWLLHRAKQALWSSRTGPLMVLVISTILVSAFDWVMWKKTLNRFHSKTTNTSYTFFLLQMYIFTMLIFSFVAVLLQYWVFDTITPEMKRFPKKKFWIMSAFDSLAVLCSSMAGAAVAGHVQTLLSQLNLPLTMLFSFLFLATLYVTAQYAGALLIIAGAVVAAVPAALDGGSTAGRENKAWGVIVYCLGALPLSFSNVYREYIFRDRTQLNIFYLMFWTSLYQFLLGFLTLPVIAIPVFGGTPFSEMPTQLTEGWRCFIGKHVDELECEHGMPPAFSMLIYVVLNFVVSIMRLLLIKYGSAVLLQVTNAMALLFSNLIFCIPFIMGEDTESFNYFDAIGLVVVLAGFVIFRLAAVREDARKHRDEIAAAADDVAALEHRHSHNHLHGADTSIGGGDGDGGDATGADPRSLAALGAIDPASYASVAETDDERVATVSVAGGEPRAASAPSSSQSSGGDASTNDRAALIGGTA